MTEPIDKARWDICERCLISLDANMRLLNYIDSNRGAKWCNPSIALCYFKIDKKLCTNCPYKLEHAVLDQENVVNE